MAAILNSLFAALFLSLILQGHCQCSISDVTVSQAQTGATVQSKPEWKVTISNNCICSQSDLKLSCNGFQTVEAVDPSVLSKSENECLINNGEPIAPTTTFTFNYAWDASFPFNPLSSTPNCS